LLQHWLSETIFFTKGGGFGIVGQQEETMRQDEDVTQDFLKYLLLKLLPCLKQLHNEQRDELKVERSLQGNFFSSLLSYFLTTLLLSGFVRKLISFFSKSVECMVCAGTPHVEIEKAAISVDESLHWYVTH